MKKIYLILLLLPTILMAQVNCPHLMERDSVYERTPVDIYFNSSNSITNPFLQPKKVDIDIYTAVTDSSNEGDTLIVELYGIKRKKRTGNTNWRGVGQTEVVATDSMRLLVKPLVSGETYWLRIPLQELDYYFGIYDGLRPVYKQTGTDADTIEVQIQFRVME